MNAKKFNTLPEDLFRVTMKSKLIIFLLLLSIAIACTSHRDESMTIAEGDSVIVNARLMLHNYFFEIKQNGLTSEFKYLDSSSNFFWVPPGSSIALSYDSIHTLISINAQLYKSVVNTWDTLKIIPLDKEHAAYTGRLQSVMTDTAGHISSFKLIETGLLIKRRNDWKLLSGQTRIVSN